MNILYICTHNRCRSILSEAITNAKGEGKLVAKSAGSEPAGAVHPLTLQYLAQAGYPTEGLTSNGWDDADYMAGFTPDLVVTVCDSAAGESCPLWLGSTPKLHWGLSDPSKLEGDAADVAFQEVISEIERRVAVMLPLADLPIEEFLSRLHGMM